MQRKIAVLLFAFILIIFVTFQFGLWEITLHAQLGPDLVTTSINATPTMELLFVGDDPHWTPIERVFDRVAMVYVPAGCFIMGSEDWNGGQDPMHMHKVCITKSFWLDKYEVSNGQFKRKGGKANSPSYRTADNLPREQITWAEADSYCQLRGARLPTEAEWEYAARGPQSLTYPWGNTFDPDKVTTFGTTEQTVPVDSYPNGISWVGAFNLSGNVEELVSDWYDGEYYKYSPKNDPTGPTSGQYRITRGGSWWDDGMPSAARSLADLNYQTGFRCARAEPSAQTQAIVEATPIPAGTFKNTWTPQERDFNGVTMVYVPAGCFLMGSNDFDLEKPVHEVCITEPFWLDKYEVSNGQFKSIGGVASDFSNWTDTNLPRERIVWQEARAYCQLRGVRLPTEAEWEYAARGPQSLIYPWGNDFVADNVTYKGNSGDKTAPVNSRPAGVSWVGAFNLSGNVAEWVADGISEKYYETSRKNDPVGPSVDGYAPRLVRGGSFIDEKQSMRGAFRMDRLTWFMENIVGFRCAISAERLQHLSRVAPMTATAQTAQTQMRLLQNTKIAATLAASGRLPNTLLLPAGSPNTLWKPIERDFDGVTMVYVPAGCFMMGSDSGLPREGPVRETCVTKPFWLDKYEVSEGQFMNKGGKSSRTTQMTNPNLPRTMIEWGEAVDYCRLRDARLPTEAEWEYAARGPQGLIFPWGNNFVVDNINYTNSPRKVDPNKYTYTVPVDSYPGGASWVGALNLSGNVWEWVNDKYYDGEPYSMFFVLRGGSYIFDAFHARTTYRNIDLPEHASTDRGFRCTRSQ